MGGKASLAQGWLCVCADRENTRACTKHTSAHYRQNTRVHAMYAMFQYIICTTYIITYIIPCITDITYGCTLYVTLSCPSHTAPADEHTHEAPSRRDADRVKDRTLSFSFSSLSLSLLSLTHNATQVYSSCRSTDAHTPSSDADRVEDRALCVGDGSRYSLQRTRCVRCKLYRACSLY
jgi:hypothetical protein